MRKKLVFSGLAAGLVMSVGLVGTVDAGKYNPNACEGRNKAHAAVIEAQGLERHLTLPVHQVFMNNLLAGCNG